MDTRNANVRKKRKRERGLGANQVLQLLNVVKNPKFFQPRAGNVYRLVAPRNELESALNVKYRQAMQGRLKRLAHYGILINWDPIEIDGDRLTEAWYQLRATTEISRSPDSQPKSSNPQPKFKLSTQQIAQQRTPRHSSNEQTKSITHSKAQQAPKNDYLDYLQTASNRSPSTNEIVPPAEYRGSASQQGSKCLERGCQRYGTHLPDLLKMIYTEIQRVEQVHASLIAIIKRLHPATFDNYPATFDNYPATFDNYLLNESHIISNEMNDNDSFNQSFCDYQTFTRDYQTFTRDYQTFTRDYQTFTRDEDDFGALDYDKSSQTEADALEDAESTLYPIEVSTERAPGSIPQPEKETFNDTERYFPQPRVPPEVRQFELSTEAISRAEFKNIIEEWIKTWPTDIAEKAPDPDIYLLYPVCSQYPLLWIQRALSLITKDLYRIGKTRSPGAVLYSAAYHGWLRYFPEEPPKTCELCGGVVMSAESSRCSSCAEHERQVAQQRVSREKAIQQEEAEKVRERQLHNIWQLNSEFMEKYGITVPRIVMTIKQHPRPDLLEADLERAAMIISQDPHLQYSPGAPVCVECKTGKVQAQKEQSHQFL